MTSAVAVRLLEREAPTSTSGGSMSLTTFKQTLIGIIILLIGYTISKQKVVEGE